MRSFFKPSLFCPTTSYITIYLDLLIYLIFKIVNFYRSVLGNFDQTWYSEGFKGNVSCLQPFALLAKWVEISTENLFFNLKWKILNPESPEIDLFLKPILSKEFWHSTAEEKCGTVKFPTCHLWPLVTHRKIVFPHLSLRHLVWKNP